MTQMQLFSYYELEEKDRPFWKYHQDNPNVYIMFKRFAFELIEAGRKAFGAKSIFERIRWETATNQSYSDPFKVNNNYTAGYARLFMKDFSEHEGFFRTRKLHSERNDVGE